MTGPLKQIGDAAPEVTIQAGSRTTTQRVTIQAGSRTTAPRVAILALALVLGCADTSLTPTADIFAPLGEAIPSATPEQLASFERGKAIATRRFTPEDGLGPTFNVTFCASCHEKPVVGGSAGHYRDFLLAGVGAPNGETVLLANNGVQPQFSFETGRAASDPRTDITATRNPIPFFGVGLLFEVTDEEILRRADPFDRDGDGISGRVNTDTGFVGRFGRKSQASSIQPFIRGPLFNHAGITTDPLTPEFRARLPMQRGAMAADDTGVVITVGENGQAVVGTSVAAQVSAGGEAVTDDDTVFDPELSEQDLFDLVSFTMLLAPPPPSRPTPTTRRGQDLFGIIGCDRCHVPELPGPRGALPAYTDLLIHDMGEALADGFTFGQAQGGEFRTQPLWGVAAVSPYLHDGRADTLDAAIRWHGGEGAAAQEAYVNLSAEDQNAVVAFLRSLGGADQRTDGLLPPGSTAPIQGYGAPIGTLSAEERQLFSFGRALFDFDFGYSNGVGPLFNGDSCRACHFDPVIGGAGPSGVDAMRQGAVIDGVFTAPPAGVNVLRHNTFGTRPIPSEAANVFEPRQTPTTLGLGLIEQIPRATIEALADPDDLDRDGISGRAHVLEDGRLGRFGWKANVPTLEEFVRDALSNELGLTVPEDANLSFGAIADTDEVADPEADEEIINGIQAFIAGLAPPPRQSVQPALEAQGEAIFASANCVACHVPSLQTETGEDVPLYSDLLLHDVSRSGAVGIEEGDAGMTEFRTPPLWGISGSAPYLHDGSAETIEDAITAHSGEAAASRAAVASMGTEARAALLAFLESL